MQPNGYVGRDRNGTQTFAIWASHGPDANLLSLRHCSACLLEAVIDAVGASSPNLRRGDTMLQCVAVLGRGSERAGDIDERRADEARVCDLQRGEVDAARSRHPMEAFIHPALVMGMKHDAGRIAVVPVNGNVANKIGHAPCSIARLDIGLFDGILLRHVIASARRVKATQHFPQHLAGTASGQFVKDENGLRAFVGSNLRSHELGDLFGRCRGARPQHQGGRNFLHPMVT